MTSQIITIGIPGAAGRMGRMLIREIDAASDLKLVAATDRTGIDAIGEDSGLLAGTGSNGVIIDDDPTGLAIADVIIDFTSNRAALRSVFSSQYDWDEAALRAAADGTALVYCANTSVGVTLLGRLVEQVAAQLVEGWDIEILESHHHHKVDAPSGTALALGHAAARGRGVDLDDVADMVRKGQTGARREGDIGFAVLRGGDVTGEHSVIFYGDSERVEISHRATDRAIFARGALRAARFAAAANPGFYNMEDVLAG